MATVVNNTGHPENSSTNAMVMGLLLLLLVGLAVWFFGAPYLRGGGATGGAANPGNTIQNNLEQPAAPASDTGTDINVPDQIDVNVDGNLPEGGIPSPGQ